jgi:hypothetical protein
MSGANILQRLRSVDWSIELAQTQPEITDIANANVAYPIVANTRQMMFTHATTLDQYLQLTHWTDLVDNYVTSFILQEPEEGSEVRVPADVNASYILRAYSGGFANFGTNDRAFIYSPAYMQYPFLGPNHDQVALSQNILNAVVDLVSDYAPSGFVSTWAPDVFQTIENDLLHHNTGTDLSTADLFGIVNDAAKKTLDDAVQQDVKNSLWGSYADLWQDSLADAEGTIFAAANFGVVAQRIAELKLAATPMESALLIVGPPPVYPTHVQTPAPITLNVFGTYQVSLVDSTGASVPVGAISKWISANSSVATVNGAGLVSGIGPGQTSIQITVCQPTLEMSPCLRH